MALTTWSRLEPHARTADISEGLAARIADPMWLLARQRQLGEFTGEDGGSPVFLDVWASWSRLTRYRPGHLAAGEDGSAEAVPYDPRSRPLEPLVEAELGGGAELGGRWWRERARLGRRLEAALRAAGESGAIDALRGEFPFPGGEPGDVTPADARWASTLAGNLTDGLDALVALTREGSPPPVVLGAAADADRLTAEMQHWRTWAERTTIVALDESRSGSPAWDPQRLEYAFAVAAPPLPDTDTEVVLVASEYHGTGIGWHSVDTDRHASLGAAGDGGATGTEQRRTLPVPVRYAGMPADRYWEMEDARVSLGAVSAGPTDLVKMLAIEYAVIYGPDWFLVPVDLPVGVVARVDGVVVRDTFGVATLVGTHDTVRGDGAGRLFQPASVDDDVADNPLLLILPSSLGALRGPPLERIDLRRDEAANLAWIIERIAEGPMGRGAVRSSEPDLADEPPEPVEADLLWRIQTSVAPYWHPLAPVREGDEEGDIRLVAAAFSDAAVTDPTLLGRGRLAGEIDKLYEEEVTRAGARLDLFDQQVRAIDGTIVSWRGREKTAGHGEVDSGLAFDRTEKLP